MTTQGHAKATDYQVKDLSTRLGQPVVVVASLKHEQQHEQRDLLYTAEKAEVKSIHFKTVQYGS